jgi:hypothetical protein
MNILIADQQTVGETESTIFSLLQNSPVSALVTLTNNGTNTMNYRFQQLSAGTWSNLDVIGTDMNNTLSTGQVKAVSVSSSYPQVRLVGNASGGAVLEFGVLRYYARAAGGALPILSL